jgi:hypothetical protein
MWATGEQITTAAHSGIGTSATNIAPGSGPTLSIALAANHTYEFEAILIVQASAGTAGLNAGVAYSGTMGDFLQNGIGEGSGTVVTFAVHASGPPAGIFSSVATTDTIVQIHGLVKTTGAGNLTAQLKKLTSGTATAQAGSLLRARQLA